MIIGRVPLLKGKKGKVKVSVRCYASVIAILKLFMVS